MAVVTGLAPVIGVPLPFISYGGSALLMSLCAIGVVLSLARAQMDARHAAQEDAQVRPGRLR